MTVFERAAQWSAVFGDGTVPGIWQHGDFSFNNLLVSDAHMTIIDFEEFGGTLVPLHDAFGLALSLTLSQGKNCPLSRPECIALCVDDALADGAFGRQHLPGLLLHHLLWRLNQCEQLGRRGGLQQILLTWVEELATSPASFLGSLAVDSRISV